VAGRKRTVLRLHPRLAPVKVAVLPLVSRDEDPEWRTTTTTAASTMAAATATRRRCRCGSRRRTVRRRRRCR